MNLHNYYPDINYDRNQYFTKCIIDKKRLEIMTSDSYIGEILFDELPPYICRYSLGIFYDLNTKKSQIQLDFYKHGQLVKNQILYYNDLGKIIEDNIF